MLCVSPGASTKFAKLFRSRRFCSFDMWQSPYLHKHGRQSQNSCFRNTMGAQATIMARRTFVIIENEWRQRMHNVHRMLINRPGRIASFRSVPNINSECADAATAPHVNRTSITNGIYKRSFRLRFARVNNNDNRDYGYPQKQLRAVPIIYVEDKMCMLCR